MKVLHCCLAAFYIDNYGYQENILPRMHKRQGHSVAILASTETYVDNRKLGYVKAGSYRSEDDIPITRLPYARGWPRRLVIKLRLYRGVYAAVAAFTPDILFLHDCQFLSIREIALYAKRNPNVRVYVDGHTDLLNSARTWVSRHILHGLIYRHCALVIAPYTTRFYGTLPIRAEFFKSVYGIPSEKVDLLVLGAEDAECRLRAQEKVRANVRRQLQLTDEAFVLVCGGKIDRRKNIHLLMRAVNRIARHDVQLILFGIPDNEMEAEILGLATGPSIRYVGWCAPQKTYDYLLAADLAVFPGTHSVLWEQAVGLGVPCVFKRWCGMQHVDVGGNCIFLDVGDAAEIEGAIIKLMDRGSVYSRMKTVAMSKGVREFSYDDIARRAIAP
jgi:1,2-diacylglycerol 3-alpha-glucosyltransferase